MSAATASEDCDFEASVKESLEDGWAEVASTLGVSHGSVWEKIGQREGDVKLNGVMESAVTPAKATLVMLLISLEILVAVVVEDEEMSGRLTVVYFINKWKMSI